MNTIGNKIKTLRESKNISKSELARKIEVSPAYITMLENGTKTNPSLEILNKISFALDIPLDKLVNSKEKPVKNLKFDIFELMSAKEREKELHHKGQSESKEINTSNKITGKFTFNEILSDINSPTHLLKNFFSVDTDSLTDEQIVEIMNAIRFTIKLKLEEFKRDKE
ncbi:helix-turn-helix transcriptional regulator [Clostridium botulinum]|uniref:Helix-turn-helix transcriptional regulator n=1 Tax=Clostridium botulinum TaxID=1491 RepID=A0A6B4JPE9_CLOBO|nr:helix-turn-helix transcriptional regulator [Clostridium botulinum]EES50044.1 helix-turn-helix domain protein [Clostridium botulinum E1 str. 'BoNT E Beluga']MBY6762318.1 helix-turn-helix transcriptional regulator [Clostridium botulinum]MBY6921161.1 helix-turn-helix transcriptional regulator [Clostridium botulinum]MCR1131982.1 helix-turn-helix transcriptional regulator [Clostridium botulinum]NFJ58822.1 helix-turn-helix transcriptional regulator [Clostridium botulinum]